MDLAWRWRRAVCSLREFGLRVAFVRSELLRTEMGAVANALNELCSDAEQADPAARDVLGAIVPSLTDPQLAGYVEQLRSIAASRALLPLSRLLRRKEPTRESLETATIEVEGTIATSRTGRALTLGERRALARRPNRAAFDVLLRDPHPLVIRNLLSNPRLTEDDVIRLASRRPAYPLVQMEISHHASWSQRVRVRMALVQNPYTPTEVSVPLVRLLIRPELLQVVAAMDVPAVVRAAATELLARRPPVPDCSGGGTLQ